MKQSVEKRIYQVSKLADEGMELHSDSDETDVEQML